MAQIAVIQGKCDGCARCVDSCPFGALELVRGKPELNTACKVCGLCVKVCARGTLIRLEPRQSGVDKSAWQGMMVLAEQSAGKLHPVSLELIGKALTLHPRVCAVIMGHGVEAPARELLHYGVESVYAFDSPELGFFRAEAFADAAEQAIRKMKPSVVLVGATALGRSLAPRLATRFRTGLTADCTALEVRENSDLVQIRPAFGGNIMAQIVTPDSRPQFATVRYRVMNAPPRQDVPSGQLMRCDLPPIRSAVRHIRTVPVPKSANISDAELLVVGGRGLKKQDDLDMLRELARLMGGELAVSRPLVEKGWAPNARQIGLSGRTVRPRLIVTCGVSGAIQFAACMQASEHIIAINQDPDAPIFGIAHVAIVGDLYEVVPELIEQMKEARHGTVQEG